MSRLPTPSEFNKRLGVAMRHHRQAAGLTMQEVGVPMGIAYQQQQKYESGKNMPSSYRLVQFCEVTGARHETLLDYASGKAKKL